MLNIIDIDNAAVEPPAELYADFYQNVLKGVFDSELCSIGPGNGKQDYIYVLQIKEKIGDPFLSILLAIRACVVVCIT